MKRAFFATVVLAAAAPLLAKAGTLDGDAEAQRTQAARGFEKLALRKTSPEAVLAQTAGGSPSGSTLASQAVHGKPIGHEPPRSEAAVEKDSLRRQMRDIYHALFDPRQKGDGDPFIQFPRFEKHRDPNSYLFGDFFAGFLWAEGPASRIKALDTYGNVNPYGRLLPKVLGWTAGIASIGPAVAVGAVSSALGLAHLELFRL